MALGNFDGLHLGHQAVIREAVAIAKRLCVPSAVLTFEPHPRRVFQPQTPPLCILPFREKALQLRSLGVDMLRVIRFTPAFAHTTATQFVTDILHQQLRTQHVVTGEDFTFGYRREGQVMQLRQLAEPLGFGVTTCAPVFADGARCSSTRIRALLTEGKVEDAARLLGRPYSITGRVRAGDGRGREIGFPTANVAHGQIFLPATGVYAVRVVYGQHLLNGVANLGQRPTFAGSQVQLEVHCFGWQGTLYGKRIEVMLLKHLREERKFESVEALQAQIAQDCSEARLFLVDS